MLTDFNDSMHLEDNSAQNEHEITTGFEENEVININFVTKPPKRKRKVNVDQEFKKLELTYAKFGNHKKKRRTNFQQTISNAHDIFQNQAIEQGILHVLGPMSEKCNYCNALYFKEEVNSRKKFTLCCNNGVVKLEKIPFDSNLRKLFLDKNFAKKIRTYNNLFAFTSNFMKLDEELLKNTTGRYTLQAQGRVSHRIPSSLYPREDKLQSFSQIYVLDLQTQSARREKIYKKANSSYIKIINQVLHSSDGSK